MIASPYCGAAPLPGELLGRFNLDPWLLAALTLVTWWHVARAGGGRAALVGWGVAAAALASPLCALSVALFSARVVQHMVLALVAAPLIAAAWPIRAGGVRGWTLVLAALAFAAALWTWHLPAPYDATFRSDALYWAMHLTLFGSALMLWRQLLHAPESEALSALLAGGFVAIAMGLLGAVLSLTPAILFRAHLASAGAWGLTPLADQQLGGLVMWVPGGFGFLWVALLAVSRLLRAGQGTSAAGSA